jgi:hypothetical protein
MYVVGFLNIIVADSISTGNFVNQIGSYCTLTDEQLKAQITVIRDLYFSQVFAKMDTIS